MLENEVELRLWAEGDFPLLEQLLGDPEMMRHLGGPETPEQLRARHARYCRHDEAGNMFAIVLGPEQVAVGSIGYWEKAWQGQVVWETGWSILPEFQGQGIATQAAAGVVERARAEGQHRCLQAFPASDNAPSNAICRKVGFSLQDEVNFEYPPGQIMRCNVWRLELATSERKSP